MKAVVQRVSFANVMVNHTVVGEIKKGLLILLGIVSDDSQEDINWLSNKIANLRIFNDQEGIMNLSALQTNAEVLVISQFTLHASTKKGNRPSYIQAAKSDIAVPLYEQFIETLTKGLNKKIETGRFGADMKVNSENDGPVTLIIDTKNKE